LHEAVDFFLNQNLVDYSDLHIDEIMEGSKSKEYNKDELQGLGGPMTRARSKKAKEALNKLVAFLFEACPSLEELQPKMVNCLMQIEGIEA